jgi:putative transposase
MGTRPMVDFPGCSGHGAISCFRAQESNHVQAATFSEVRRIYEFMKTYRHEHSVQIMCRVLQVTRSGYYAWLQEPISSPARENALLRLIRAPFLPSHGIYRAPRVFLDLRKAGVTCSNHRVARLMRVNNIRGVRGYGTRSHSVTFRLDTECPAAELHRRQPQSGLGHGYNLQSKLARAALSRCGHGSILPKDRRVVDAAHDRPRTRPRRSDDGRAAASPQTSCHSDQGSQDGSDDRQRFCRTKSS